MSYPWSTAQIDAIGRLAVYNGNAYNASTNPKGMANGGHRTNFTPSLNDSSTAAGAIKEAADFAGAKADAASASEANALAYAAKMSGSSSTAVAIGSGSKTFTTQAGKFFEPGRTLRIASAANPNTAYMVGKVTAYSGTALTVSVLLFVGSGSPADWVIFVDGELGPSGTVTVTGATSLAPDQFPSVLNSGTSTAAILAFGIPRGMPAGLYFKWSTDASATDPTTGRIKVNSASLTAATSLYISEIDANGVAQSAVIAAWDDSTNPVRSTIRIEDIANPANFVVYTVTGVMTDNGAWDIIPVAYVDKGGTLTNSASVRVEVMRAGDKGDTGTPGTNGTAATITVQSTTTGAAGSAASVTNTGTANAALLNFTVPRGNTGATGPVIATRFNFDTSIADADPGDGNVRFNSATISSVTQIFLDNLEATGGISVAAYIDTFDDSTNPSVKGTLTFKDTNDQSKFVIFNITGTVQLGTGSGYRKVTVAYQSGNGGFTSGAQLGMAFDRSGDKGADGGGAGNVVGPATSTQGNFALFGNAAGTLLTNGGAPGALATKSTVGDGDFSAAGGQQLSVAKGGTGATTSSAARDNLGLTIGSNVQAYSAKLDAFVALTWAANKGVYFTSASAVATYDQTAFGRSLEGASDAAAAQAILQLVPGTNVQTFNANLQALSGLTGAADKIAYFTAAGAFSLADFSSFTRTLTGQTSAANWRSTLGLGSAATVNAGTTIGTLALLQTGGVFDPATQPQITGGDVTAPAGSAVHTLIASGVTAGSYTGLHSATFDAKGRATAAANVALTGDVTTVAGSLVTTLAATAVTAGGYTGLHSVTFDAKGRATAAANVALTGDVTTVAGSLVTTITPNAVINGDLAKMPSGTIKANLTGATADPTDVSLTALLNTLSSTQGAIIYRASAGWAALPPGTTGQVLTTGGANANPSWITAAAGGGGKYLDRAYAEYTSIAALSNVMPVDGTIPQSNEGTQILSVSITPKSSTSILRASFAGSFVAFSGAPDIAGAIFWNNSTNALTAGYFNGSGAPRELVLPVEWVPGSTSPVTVSVRVGPGTSTNIGLMSNLGGSGRATLVVEEVAA